MNDSERKILKTKIRNFIWNNKPLRISYEILIEDYDSGGLKLQDIIMKDQAFKAQWIYKIHKLDPFFKEMAKSLLSLPKMLKDYAVELNLKSKEVPTSESTDIWNQIFKTWCTFNYYVPTNKEEILNQIIWYNSHIQIDNTVLYNSALVRKGCIYVKDLLTENGIFMTFDQFKDKWQCYDFLSYHAIKMAIPKEWLKIVKLDNLVTPQTLLGCKKIEKTKTQSVTKTIYCVLLSRTTILNKQKNQWAQELEYEILDDDWNQAIRRLFKNTKCTKLRAFHYRLHNRILTTNINRNKWDNRIPSLCHFCGKSTEMYVHLFVLCPHIVKIWKVLTKWLYYFCNINLTISKETVIFNSYNDSFKDMVNFIILVVKQYIYAQKCPDLPLVFRELIVKIRYYKNLEYISAKKCKNLTHFQKNWNMYDKV